MEKDIDIKDLIDSISDDEAEVLETKATYEIWLVADDENDCALDFEVLLDDGYTLLENAKECYDYCSNSENLITKLNLMEVEIPDEAKHFYLRLEAVIDDETDTTLCNEIIEECEVKIK